MRTRRHLFQTKLRPFKKRSSRHPRPSTGIPTISPLNAQPLTPHLGAAISNIDVAKTPDKSTAKALLHLLDTRGLVIIRGQQLTPDKLVAFSRALGDLHEYPLEKIALTEYPQVMPLSNIIEHGEPIGTSDAGARWRIDGAHLKTPHRATLLYAVEIPTRDNTPLGDTWFASTAAAHDALELALRQQLQGMLAIHMLRAGRKKRSTPYFPDSGLTQSFRRGVEHPVIRTHPPSGRKCLYVNPVTTSHIRGMNEHDSGALLDQLYEHMARPEFAWRHQWQAGDVVICDNGLTQTRTAIDYELPQRRLLYRVQIKGAA